MGPTSAAYAGPPSPDKRIWQAAHVTHEREITEPVDLCAPDGRLNPDAVGWSRRPLHRANLRGWGRRKRWEYWGIVTPDHVVGVVLSSLDYAGVNGLYVLDRATGREYTADAVVPLAHKVALPERCGEGVAAANSGSVRIRIDQTSTTTTITAHGAEIELALEVGRGGESLGVVVPWTDKRFQYTVKDVARPVSGTITVSGTAHEVPAGSFAVLDHGRGKWPYSMTWNWAAGSRADRTLGLQLGGKWTDGTGMTENAVVVDGRLHKIGEELLWSYDRADWLAPWRITGEHADITFTPFHERVSRTNLLVLAGETHQCFGHFTGWVSTEEGGRFDVDGVVGWAEEAHNRW